MLDYQEQIEGTKGNLYFNEHQASFIVSTPKGVRFKEILKGNNSQGPYQLAYTPVVVNSESVEIGGIKKERDTEYRIDYSTGKINFLKEIIPNGEEITIVYESSNSQYGQQITGLRYQFSGIPSANTSVYFIQKKEQDTLNQNKSTQTDILLLTQDYATGPFWLNSELGLSRYNLDITTTNNTLSGTAGYLKIGWTNENYQISSYFSKLSTNFYPLNSYKIHPGDLTYGFAGNYTYQQQALSTAYDYLNLHENSGQSIEENLQVAGKTEIYSLPVSLTYKQKSYLSWTELPTSQYLRRNLDSATQISTLFGKIVANVGAEINNDLLLSTNSYLRKSVQAGYSAAPLTNLSFALDAGYKETDWSAAPTEKEKSAKFSSNLNGDTLYSVAGFYELIQISNKPDITIYDLQSHFKPLSNLEFEANLNDERLLETVNNLLVDTEKVEANFRLKFDPIKNIRLDLNYKPKYKQAKPSNLKLSNKDLYTLNLSWPMFKLGSASYMFKEQQDYLVQVKYYPDALFQDNINKLDTHILRWRFNAWQDISVNLQYEKSFTNKDTLIATNNALYNFTRSEKAIKKAELSKQFDNITLGLIYENTDNSQKQPSENFSIEDKTSILSKFQLNENLLITPKISILNTKTNLESYGSFNPEISVSYMFLNMVQLNLRYSYLQANKTNSVEKTQQYDCSAKAELSKNFLLELSAQYENHQNPDSITYSGQAKASILF